MSMAGLSTMRSGPPLESWTKAVCPCWPSAYSTATGGIWAGRVLSVGRVPRRGRHRADIEDLDLARPQRRARLEADDGQRLARRRNRPERLRLAPRAVEGAHVVDP